MIVLLHEKYVTPKISDDEVPMPSETQCVHPKIYESIDENHLKLEAFKTEEPCWILIDGEKC